MYIKIFSLSVSVLQSQKLNSWIPVSFAPHSIRCSGCLCIVLEQAKSFSQQYKSQEDFPCFLKGDCPNMLSDLHVRLIRPLLVHLKDTVNQEFL